MSTLQLIPFPGRLIIDDMVLDDECVVSDYALEEGSSLDFMVDASKEYFTQQLSKLLYSRDMSCDELSLLYRHKHGANAIRALRILGCDGEFQEFINTEKTFSLLNGRVGLVQQKNNVKDIPAEMESAQTSSVLGFFDGSLPSCDPTFSDNQYFLDLHDQINDNSLCTKATRMLDEIMRTISTRTFLNVLHIVKSGSVGKGTAISEAYDAELILFLLGIPTSGHSCWLPPLLVTVMGILSECLGGRYRFEGFHILDDSVQMHVGGLMTVSIRISPVFAGYMHTIQTLAGVEPEFHRHFNISFVKDRTEFISRQSRFVKMTIRLLKWWRNQQEWSCKLAFPSDDILELTAVYSAVRTKSTTQRDAISNVMSLFSCFDKLKVVWSNFYRKEDVWRPLLRQRPLLMDPVNPYLNVANPQTFDACDLMRLAQLGQLF